MLFALTDGSAGAKGGARITNVPTDYQTVESGAKIASYTDIVKL